MINAPKWTTPIMLRKPRPCMHDVIGPEKNAPRQSGAFAALGGLGLLIDGGLGDIGQRFVRRLLFLKGLLQK
jgi:hypothetical protein